MLKDLERKGKVFLRGAFRLIPKVHPIAVEDLETGIIGKILVIRLDNRLGNMLLITPFLNGLRKCFPDATIDVLASRAFSEVLDGNPDIDSVIVADKPVYMKGPWRFVRFIRELRGEGYGLCVDLSSSHTFSVSSAVAVRLSGAPLRLGFRRGESDRFLNVLVDPPEDPMHEAEIHLKLLEGLGPPGVNLRLGYTMSDEEVAAGREMLGKMGLRGGPVVGVFIGARGEKAWGDRHFIEVAGELSRDARVIIMGGRGERERLEGFREKESERLRVAPVLPLRRFAALVKQCDLFISGDCGPMHLAAALGVKVIAIFTVDNFSRYRPLGEGNLVLHEPAEREPSRVAEIARRMLKEDGKLEGVIGKGVTA